MRTADFRAFNEGFDHACKVICEANANGRYHEMLIRGFARGFRYDRWWCEGTETAIEWAIRNGGPKKKSGIYR